MCFAQIVSTQSYFLLLCDGQLTLTSQEKPRVIEKLLEIGKTIAEHSLQYHLYSYLYERDN